MAPERKVTISEEDYQAAMAGEIFIGRVGDEIVRIHPADLSAPDRIYLNDFSPSELLNGQGDALGRLALDNLRGDN